MASGTANYEEYTSLSGVEIQAVFDSVKFGDLHMIKFATQRDVSNIHVMGRVDAVGTGKGKRQVSGACVFSIFQKDRLMEAVNNSGAKVFLTNHELYNYGDGKGEGETSKFEEQGQLLKRGQRAYSTLDPDVQLERLTNTSIFEFGTYGGVSNCLLADQVPPFDITLVGVSETTGRMRRMVIHGVQFSSDQGGTSIDDMVLERQMSFLARRVTPWGDPGTANGGTGRDPKGFYAPGMNGK